MTEQADIPSGIACARARIPAKAGISTFFPARERGGSGIILGFYFPATALRTEPPSTNPTSLFAPMRSAFRLFVVLSVRAVPLGKVLQLGSHKCTSKLRAFQGANRM